MFYLLAIGSMLGYVVQSTLLVHHARTIDGLSLAFYRNASFIITLLPLTIGATKGDFLIALEHWKFFVLAGLAGGIYLAFSFLTYRSIPVGVANTFSKASGTLTTVALGWLWLGQAIGLYPFLCIVLIICGSLLLGLQKKNFDHIDNRHLRGIFICILNSIPWAVTSVAFAALTVEGNVLLSGYLWEAAIGVAALLLILLRYLCFGIRLQPVSLGMFWIIALCSLPTLIGTGLFSIALRYGPIGIFSGIGGSSLAVSALLAWLFYNEKLNPRQWLSIGVVLAGVIAIRFV